MTKLTPFPSRYFHALVSCLPLPRCSSPLLACHVPSPPKLPRSRHHFIPEERPNILHQTPRVLIRRKMSSLRMRLDPRHIRAPPRPLHRHMIPDILRPLRQPRRHIHVRRLPKRHSINERALLRVLFVRAHGASGALEEEHHRPRYDFVEGPDVVRGERAHVLVDPHGETQGRICEREGGLQGCDGLHVEVRGVGGEEMQFAEVCCFFWSGFVCCEASCVIRCRRFKPEVGHDGDDGFRVQGGLVAEDDGAEVAGLPHVAGVGELVHEGVEGVGGFVDAEAGGCWGRGKRRSPGWRGRRRGRLEGRCWVGA